MRLKIYLATYLLFIVILFSCLGIVSAYMTSAQINMYTEKCIREYQTISHALFRDLSVLAGRGEGFAHEFNILFGGYRAYYRQHGIEIEITYLAAAVRDGLSYTDTVVSHLRRGGEHYIHITGVLPAPFEFFRLDYFYNITAYMAEMSRIQNILLLVCIIFSVIAAIVLYFILSVIFKPLGMVSEATRKIAGGEYSERIHVKGKNELSEVAEDFNRMAAEIERQIHLLAGEAAAKQQFIDNFAHEIRTPLTSIFGNAEYMQRAVLDDGETIELTQLIMNNSAHMKQMSGSLLQLATLRNYTPVKSEISVARLFDDIGLTMRSSLYEKQAMLRTKVGIDTMYGQEDLIKSLLLNLCYNALKACAEHEGVIVLEAAAQEGKAVLSVTDNGCGISAESLPKLTEPFYRVDKARSREHGGVGLGLTLCRQIADVHGAEMVIESVVGVGTTVRVIFTTS